MRIGQEPGQHIGPERKMCAFHTTLISSHPHARVIGPRKSLLSPSPTAWPSPIYLSHLGFPPVVDSFVLVLLTLAVQLGDLKLHEPIIPPPLHHAAPSQDPNQAWRNKWLRDARTRRRWKGAMTECACKCYLFIPPHLYRHWGEEVGTPSRMLSFGDSPSQQLTCLEASLCLHGISGRVFSTDRYLTVPAPTNASSNTDSSVYATHLHQSPPLNNVTSLSPSLSTTHAITLTRWFSLVFTANIRPYRLTWLQQYK
ncbi:uncharacterized protein C8R40DRAFT_512157 [Lentinula edodes]|uniref:uncharacterized protein n=1 Tax=Lentinula edodes TaxID=5353 RepID=UPI001E8E7D56|nr:uncharacterized protein C8R40DRAFT_512157 [Lentinula edodes]KAH7871909.1 hypothetical protein C8R40DRAFT_512157 [Lentinula edodes]